MADGNSKYDQNAIKANTRNIYWMSVSFSLIFFGEDCVTCVISIGINTYRNFAVPLLGFP
mgnify:FL=1